MLERRSGCAVISMRRRCWGVPWILDVDATVKPLFGHQEGAGYNPHKPGRPSHTLHTYWVAGLRLVLDVEVKAGNEQAHSAPALWGLGWAAGRGCCAGMPSLGLIPIRRN